MGWLKQKDRHIHHYLIFNKGTFQNTIAIQYNKYLQSNNKPYPHLSMVIILAKDLQYLIFPQHAPQHCTPVVPDILIAFIYTPLAIYTKSLMPRQAEDGMSTAKLVSTPAVS
jgi:hypothetical protein